MAKRLLLIVLFAMVAILGSTLVLAHGDGDPVHGAELYAEYCLACHGPTGEGRAEFEAFASAIAYDVSFEEVVAEGVEDTYMMGWSSAAGGPLSDADIADLRAYAQSWHEGVAEPLPAPVIPDGLDPEAAAGAELYITNCAGCHGGQGEGRGLAGFPAIGEYVDLLAIARRGAAESGMPPFAEAYGGPLTEDELASIVTYTRTWVREPEMVTVAEQGPQGAAMAILLLGLGAITVIGGIALTTRRGNGQ